MTDKADTGKLRWGLMPWTELKEVVRVFMFGANKYSDFGWMTVNKARDRYWDACMRHLLAARTPGEKDPETGISHLAHLICSALIVMWHDKQRSTDDKKTQD